jgi:hypothetical protein
MNDWKETLKQLAPTVATALLGPAGGIAVSAIGSIFGMTDATPDSIAKAIKDGQITPEQITELKKLELQYQNDEKERGFKYADLAFKDRDSARKYNVAGNVQDKLFWMSIMLLVATLGCELMVLFGGYPQGLPEMIVGRVLGLMDSVTMLVLAYWYGTTNGSAQKTDLLAQAPSIK